MEKEKQEPFVQRMIDEASELKEKLTKLNIFLKSRQFTDLDDYQRALLIRQREAMSVYFETLSARLLINIKD